MSNPNYPSPGSFPGAAANPRAYQQQPHMQLPHAPAAQVPQTPPQAAGIPSLAGAKAGNTNGRWFDPGQYVVDVCEVKIVNTFKGLFFIVVCTVVETTNPGFKPGDEVSWAKTLDPAKDQYGYSRNDVKGWICAAIDTLHPGADAARNWDDAFTAFVADEQRNPCRGIRFFVNAFEKRTKGGNPPTITIVDWEAQAPGTLRGLVPA